MLGRLTAISDNPKSQWLNTFISCSYLNPVQVSGRDSTPPVVIQGPRPLGPQSLLADPPYLVSRQQKREPRESHRRIYEVRLLLPGLIPPITVLEAELCIWFFV